MPSPAWMLVPPASPASASFRRTTSPKWCGQSAASQATPSPSSSALLKSTPRGVRDDRTLRMKTPESCSHSATPVSSGDSRPRLSGRAELDGPFIEPALVRIPEGWFLMGSDSGQDCERPVHRVGVDAFRLAATQVTNAEYAAFLHAPSALPPPFWEDSKFNDPQQPVAGPSWFEASRYCEWLSAETGRAYRLPTEAEWERAARAGAEQKNFPWGAEPPQSLPDYATRWQTGPEPVARYAPNSFSLYNICD